MATKAQQKAETVVSEEPEAAGAAKQTTTPRKIPGNLPYLPASGTLKKALTGLIEASRPEKFNADFLENVLKLKGGSARATIPIMKRLGMVASDGTPTEMYARFRTEGGRGGAALQALRAGFPEIFKRSEYAYSVDENKLRDIILEITGLKSSDPVAQAIKSTFNVVKSFIPAGFDPASDDEDVSYPDDDSSNPASPIAAQVRTRRADTSSSVGLVYNINIVLPETSDLKVLNAIFRSLKENLL